MESVCWTRKPSKCWGHHNEHCFCRLRNFTFELFDSAPTTEHATPKLSLDLSQPAEVTLTSNHFTIKIGSQSSPVLHCNKADLPGWANMLSVFNGRDKPWTPIPMPNVCHSAAMACINFIHQHGLKEEGVFRLPGSSQEIDTLYLNFVTERKSNLDGSNIHVVCGCLKKLLRALPETVLTNRVYAVVTDQKSNATEVSRAMQTLPSQNSEVLAALFKLMKEICASPATKMNKEALGICMTPCWSRKDISLVEHMTLSFEPLFHFYGMGTELEEIRQSVERTVLPEAPRSGSLALPPKKPKLTDSMNSQNSLILTSPVADHPSPSSDGHAEAKSPESASSSSPVASAVPGSPVPEVPKSPVLEVAVPKSPVETGAPRSPETTAPKSPIVETRTMPKSPVVETGAVPKSPTVETGAVPKSPVLEVAIPKSPVTEAPKSPPPPPEETEGPPAARRSLSRFDRSSSAPPPPAQRSPTPVRSSSPPSRTSDRSPPPPPPPRSRSPSPITTERTLSSSPLLRPRTASSRDLA